MKRRTLQFLQLLVASIFIASCGTMPLAPVVYTIDNPPTPNPEQTSEIKAVYVNPHPVGSLAHFKAKKNYRKTSKTWKNKALLASTSSSETRIVIDLSEQRGTLYKGDTPVMNYAVSTGKRKYRTPTGSYKVIEKIRKKRSNLYGKIYNASGGIAVGRADSRRNKVPAGGKFVGASMPYWMRLTSTGIGMHQGRVPRHAASHGCIRTHSSAVQTVFNKVKIGTPVKIVQ